MKREDFDLFMVHFGASDTAAHHFWAFHDRDSPRRPQDVDPALEGVLRRVYVALDRAVGELMETAGAEHVLLASDHGFGGSGDKVVYLNRFLAARGWLRFARGAGRPSAVGVATRMGLGLVPGRMQEWLWRRANRQAERAETSRRFHGIDWGGTRVFSEELAYHPCLRLNLAGREPEGVVTPGAADALVKEVVDALERDLRDPWNGRPVVRKAWRREEIYHGEAVEDAPEIILDMAFDEGYSYNCLSSGGPGPVWRRLEAGELLGQKGAGMNGTHRRYGFWLGAGPGFSPRRKRAKMVDMAPTMLSALGIAAPPWVEGHSQLTQAGLGGVEVRSSGGPTQSWSGYDDAQRAVIEGRLRKLGYL
jgi:predicted AlkP superfamily phosphohydrolase/phosphomutase